MARPRWSATLRGQRGVTLPELTAVLALLGLMLAGVIGTFDTTLTRWRVRTAASELASVLRAARARAIRDSAETTIPFDTTRRRYLVATSGSAHGTRLVGGSGGPTLEVVELPVAVDFARPGGATPTITLSRPPSSMPVAVFDAKGLLVSATTPGYVYLGSSDEGIYSRVGVNVVGIVEIERWTGSAWE